MIWTDIPESWMATVMGPRLSIWEYMNLSRRLPKVRLQRGLLSGKRASDDQQKVAVVAVSVVACCYLIQRLWPAGRLAAEISGRGLGY
ncbi:MAG: hypothetical protein J2P41_22985, partial [Blastocatellia bacterium]|nr:hypothetical protein [Blastocatellia bacterium]